MELEQVKEHFKYAKEVRCLGDDGIYNLQNMTEKGIHYFDNHIFFIDNYNGNCVLYQETTNQLAEILTYIFDRGEEVEVKDLGDGKWNKYNFLTFKGCLHSKMAFFSAIHTLVVSMNYMIFFLLLVLDF